MKEKILNNFSLKILSIVCAIIMWGAIVNIYDPATSVTITGVNVTLENAQSLTDKDYIFEVIDGSKISVYISGPRSIVSEIKSSDIIATADLSKVTAFSDYVDIDVKLSKVGVSASSVELTPKTTAVKLSIENRVSSIFNIQLQTVGDPASGYIVTDGRISPATVKVTGSASAIAGVDTVRAIYDVSGAAMDITGTAKLAMYDESGNEILNDKIELAKTDVDFKATVLPCKTVEIKYKSQGEVASGYKLTGIEFATTQAVIAGTAENLKKIDSIEVPATAIDVSNLSADKDYSIYLSNYVPGQFMLVSDNKVIVTAKVSALHEKSYTFKTDSIALSNLADGYKASFGDVTEYTIGVTGTQNVLDSIVESDLKPTLNLKGLVEGAQNVVLNVTLPIGAELKKTYEVKVNITKQETSTTPATTIN